MMRSLLLAPFVGVTLTTAVAAQVPPIVPYPRTLDMLVVDSTYDGVWRLSDQNQDGDYNDALEVVSFYSDVTGSVVLTNPTCVAWAPNGTTYLGDSTIDIVMALRDQNGDGDAVDAGEHGVFFHSATNANAIVMASIQGITVDALGRLFCAVSNAGTSGQDMILRLEDQNGDGDADDANESLVYCLIPNGAGAVGNSIPTKVVIGPDANLYYSEVGTTLLVTKGVWKLTDGNLDGDCNDAGEVTLFWAPPFGVSPFYWSLAVDWAGNFYVTDHSTNEQVWRARDADNSGTIDVSEQQLYYQTLASTWWDVVLRDDGTVLLGEAQSPDRWTACKDLNADGDALDLNEASQAYDSTAASLAISVRGGSMMRAPQLSLQPPIVPIGQTSNLTTWASKPGDLTVVVLSVGLGPNFPLAPWGTVEIDVSAFTSIGLGFADAAGFFTLPLALPNSPSAIGTWGVQSLSGDSFRLFLSNASLLTVTP